MRDIQFTNGEYYHIFNRGVDKRITFQDGADYFRFYKNLFLLNDSEYSAVNGKKISKLSDDTCRRLALESTRKPMIQIASFCLMPNHFHLLVKQSQDGGVSRFMHRIDTGYTKYFNKRYERTGSLFEGSFKAKHINRDSYLEHIPRYIHLNVLDLVEPKWREGAVENWSRAVEYLDQYPWVSHGVYIDRPQRLPVVDGKTVQSLFRSSGEYLDFLRKWCQGGRSLATTSNFD